MDIKVIKASMNKFHDEENEEFDDDEEITRLQSFEDVAPSLPVRHAFEVLVARSHLPCPNPFDHLQHHAFFARGSLHTR